MRGTDRPESTTFITPSDTYCPKTTKIRESCCYVGAYRLLTKVRAQRPGHRRYAVKGDVCALAGNSSYHCVPWPRRVMTRRALRCPPLLSK